jgi:hypothetical protein
METEDVEYQCSDCGSTVSADAKVCKNCGANLEEIINDELPENEQANEELSKTVAKELAEGKGKENIVKELVKQNWSVDSANQFVNNIEQESGKYLESCEGRQVMAGKCARQMLFGTLWVIGGIVVTAATYNAAASSPTGGRYFVAWGAVVFGIYDFFKGLFGWLKYKE